MLVADLPPVPAQETPIVWVQTVPRSGEDGARLEGVRNEATCGAMPVGYCALRGLSDYHLVFGTAQSDTLTGSANKDYLFGGGGGAGDDTLNGSAGADQLFGGDDGDTLDGGDGSDKLFGDDGDDVLTGGTGSDLLQGGAGDDTYRFSSGDGVDVIRDADGQGSIEFDGQALSGGKKLADGYWISDDKQFTFTQVENSDGGNDLVISRRGQNDGIRIQNWQAGQLGITLDDTPADKDQPAFQVTGDQKPVADGEGNYSYDSYDNVVTTGEAQPGFADVIFGSNDNDKLSGGEGNDGISGYMGDDEIDGGAGDDLLSGGAGQDHILGGAGNDYIFAGGTYNGTRVKDPNDDPYVPPPNSRIVGATWAVYPSEVVLDGEPTTVDTIQSVGNDGMPSSPSSRLWPAGKLTQKLLTPSETWAMQATNEGRYKAAA
ncbi:MAG: calcium-binding protein [Sulfuricella sp.]